MDDTSTDLEDLLCNCNIQIWLSNVSDSTVTAFSEEHNNDDWATIPTLSPNHRLSPSIHVL